MCKTIGHCKTGVSFILVVSFQTKLEFLCEATEKAALFIGLCARALARLELLGSFVGRELLGEGVLFVLL